MSDPTIKQIQFIQNHQTTLDAGEYEITVTQTIKIKSQVEDEKFISKMDFAICSSRFSLQPQDIHAVFPPENSLGDHSNVLPHVALESSTLPWERLVHPHASQEIPWLALLLLHDDEKLLKTVQKEDFLNTKLYDEKGKEIANNIKTSLWQYLLNKSVNWLISTGNENEVIIIEKESRKLPNLNGNFSVFDSQIEAFLAQSRSIKILTLKQLKTSSQGTIKWPGITLEVGQHEEDRVSVIDMPLSLLSRILPTSQDMGYLAHVRQKTGGRESSEPLAVVVSNRLPKKNGASTAYLVSLENRYLDTNNFNFQNATQQDYIRLVVLKSWSFSCSDPKDDPKQSFKGLLQHLNVGTLQLPNCNHEGADAYSKQGYVPLRHYLRQGGKTFSWYHSPLLPGENTTDPSLSQFAVRCADQLIAYDENNGLFDISYAAAWQLGQLLALQDKKLAINLFNWKRANAQKLAKYNQQALYPHLFPTDYPNASSSLSLPKDVGDWFKQLARLSGVPFNYLVPDDKMLPPESIGFFWLDWFWVESLLDGAFSIGRVHESNSQLDTLPNQVKQITGCLIRSEVVAGWPDLQIDASSSLLTEENPMQEIGKLKLLRRDRLSQDVLICLFEGEIQTLDISLKPEGLHFGFNNDGEKLWRELRTLDGIKQNDWKVEPIAWKDENIRVIDIDSLINGNNGIKQVLVANKEVLKEFTSAQFALQMIQGVDKVSFSKSQ